MEGTMRIILILIVACVGLSVAPDARAAETWTDCQGNTMSAPPDIVRGSCFRLSFTADGDDHAFNCLASVCVVGFDPNAATDGAVSGRTVDLRKCVGVGTSSASANTCPTTGNVLTGAGGSAASQAAFRSIRGGTIGSTYLMDVTGQGTIQIEGN